jgi:mandelate racemase
MAVPKIRELHVRAVRVPMEQPHKTASGTISESPLVLTDIVADDGTIGHSMIFTYTVAALKPTAELVRNLESVIKGEPLAPVEIADRLAKRFRLLGMQGLVAMAVSAIDMALWDLLARSQNASLARLLGAAEKPIPAYAGVGYDGVAGSASVAEHFAKLGFKGVKAKIGYPSVEEDLEVVRAMRNTVGNEMAIMVDYNQSLSPPEAVRQLRLLDEEGLTWVEEPVLAHDYQGHALVARETKTPIQCGENWWGPHDMRLAIEARASDYMMPDVMKMGGCDGLDAGCGSGRSSLHPAFESSVARN